MKLFPAEYSDSIYGYDFEGAYLKGKRLVLFDIDNTMVPHGAPADERSKELIESLKSRGFKLCAVSNNGEARVRMFCDEVEVPYVFKAGKPLPLGFLKAVADMGERTETALFFGDQIFTDILGANRAGITSVLVKPVDRSTDEPHIRLKRVLERPVVICFFRHKKLAINEYFS